LKKATFGVFNRSLATRVATDGSNLFCQSLHEIFNMSLTYLLIFYLSISLLRNSSALSQPSWCLICFVVKIGVIFRILWVGPFAIFLRCCRVGPFIILWATSTGCSSLQPAYDSLFRWAASIYSYLLYFCCFMNFCDAARRKLPCARVFNPSCL
jgi:hypothetical protein